MNFSNLDIFKIKAGDVVINAHPDSGYESDQIINKKHLKTNKKYTIEKVAIGSWHTDIYLKEFPDIAFNSVHFDMCEKEQEK